MQKNWQPYLFGQRLRLRPLFENDFESLFAAASDPLIWEQHPDKERYTRERFEVYFQSGLNSKGALVAIDLLSGRIVGSSRYTDHNIQTSSVEIGFTFLTRPYWGGTINFELKSLMLNHAFNSVDTAFFVVGQNNLRSRKAMSKIGGHEILNENKKSVTGNLNQSIVFEMQKSDWSKRQIFIPFIQPSLETMRLILEPITEIHSQALWELYGDPKLHDFVPYQPIPIEKQQERCARWATRRSSDGSELWLNWAGMDRTSKKIVAHFQVGVKSDGVASLGYLVSREFQGKGIATEGLESVFSYLQNNLDVREIKAWTDTRNIASHQLARKLGMTQIEFIKDADFFKGAPSHEYVFSRVFK